LLQNGALHFMSLGSA